MYLELCVKLKSMKIERKTNKPTTQLATCKLVFITMNEISKLASPLIPMWKRKPKYHSIKDPLCGCHSSNSSTILIDMNHDPPNNMLHMHAQDRTLLKPNEWLFLNLKFCTFMQLVQMEDFAIFIYLFILFCFDK